jgi:hypothetical protein
VLAPVEILNFGSSREFVHHSRQWQLSNTVIEVINEGCDGSEAMSAVADLLGVVVHRLALAVGQRGGREESQDPFQVVPDHPGELAQGSGPAVLRPFEPFLQGTGPPVHGWGIDPG